METVALAMAITVILFPVAYVWYLTLGGILAAVKARRAARRGAMGTVVAR